MFNKEYYLHNYPNVRQMRMTPLMHFIKAGWKEGKNPSEVFDTNLYFELNPDVENENLNPLVHYIKYGKREGRRIPSDKLGSVQYDYVDLSLKDSFLQSVQMNSINPPNSVDIIIFPIIDWHFRFQRPQQLARQFAKQGHRVFYMRTSFFEGQAPQISKIEKNIYSVKLARGERVIKFNTTLDDESVEVIAKSIRILKNAFLINSAIMIVDLPFWRKLVIRLKYLYNWKLIYDCMDLYADFSGSSALTEEDEEYLLKECDIVIATSHLLYEHVNNDNNYAVFIPNGTDFDFFHQAAHLIHKDEIEDLPLPIIGYYGAISDWFDTSLVGYLASKHPEWSFLLIGNTHGADLRPLKGKSNVHLLGEKPYSDIPAYLSYFNVGIIPFKKCSLTHATNPVKMFEYLSAGKPVVSTRLHEISNYGEYVRLAETKEDWEIAIKNSLSENNSTELLKKRYEFARANTWEKRAEKIESVAFNLFPKVSIIIVTHNNLEYTSLCLESIVKNTEYPNYEIIIVDKGSNNETVIYLDEFRMRNKKVSLLLNNSSLEFKTAITQGFHESRGKYIVLLHYDTIVTSGWIYRLLFHFKKNPSAGMIGPVTNACDNEAKINITYTNLDEINTFSAHRAIEFEGKAFTIKVLGLYCCMTLREYFEDIMDLEEQSKLDRFDEEYLARKIGQKGLDLLCAEDVFIHHFHGANSKNK